jgi:hypothetical protein
MMDRAGTDPELSLGFADSVGFEPTVPFGTQVFKTCTFGLSVNCPLKDAAVLYPVGPATAPSG